MISFIDPAAASEHLNLAEKHVMEGQQRVDAQVTLVLKLKRHGHDVHEAEALLRQFEQILALQVQHRNRIAQELANLNAVNLSR
jgi:hypothetical protein